MANVIPPTRRVRASILGARPPPSSRQSPPPSQWQPQRASVRSKRDWASKPAGPSVDSNGCQSKCGLPIRQGRKGQQDERANEQVGPHGQPTRRGRAGLTKDEDLASARNLLARALGAASRRYWRRNDRTPADDVVCALIAEALARLSRLLRGPSGAGAREIIAQAPLDIRKEVGLSRPYQNPGG